MDLIEEERLVVPGGMKMEPGSKIGLTGEDSDFDLLNQLKAEALTPVQEDLAIWLNKILGAETDVSVENFLDRLDSGVLLCRLAEIIEKKKAAKQETSTSIEIVAGIRYKRESVSGSWWARDNTTNFILWCRSVGIKDECLFETEGLVLHRDLRNIVLCLLEVARIGAQYGLELPAILKLEKEIDLEETSYNGDEIDSKVKVEVQQKKKVTAVTSTNEKPKSPKIVIKKEKSCSYEALDKKVMLMSGKCRCKGSCNQMRKIADGRYILGQKIICVRILNDRHLMVRVGGGWDTLEHYLVAHDPCKIKEFRRKDDTTPFLLVQGKYKVDKSS